MAARQIAAGPDGLQSFCVNAGRAVAAKVKVDCAFLDDRSRGGVGVYIITERLRLRVCKEKPVEDYLTAVSVHTDSGHLAAIVCSGCKPNLISPDDRGRPAFAVDRRFPFY